MIRYIKNKKPKKYEAEIHEIFNIFFNNKINTEEKEKLIRIIIDNCIKNNLNNNKE